MHPPAASNPLVALFMDLSFDYILFPVMTGTIVIILLSICGFKLIKFGNYSKDHMYGIFSVGNDLKKNNFSNLYETKYILYSRYFKFYKLIFFIFRNILNKFIYRK